MAKMKHPTSLSLTEKPQNKHDAPRGIQKDYNNNFATEVAEPACCVKYLQKKMTLSENMKQKFGFEDQNFYFKVLVPF